MKGKITVSRITSSLKGEDFVEIALEDSTSLVGFTTIRMGLEEFAQAITGQGYVPCEFVTRGLDLVGKKRETKIEPVFVLEGPHSTRQSRAQAAVEVEEIDGWVGRIEDAMNHHKCTERNERGEWYSVTFVRHIE